MNTENVSEYYDGEFYEAETEQTPTQSRSRKHHRRISKWVMGLLYIGIIKTYL